ncbi:MAG: hypothetical protein NTV34_03290 [Proteobacteria bacterium]|nr:hypothetical protein [Pseudomonadota bacterium]
MAEKKAFELANDFKGNFFTEAGTGIFVHEKALLECRLLRGSEPMVNVR